MTPEDALLVHALASGLCQAEAATLAGVSRATVTRRLRDAEFCQAVNELRADHVRRVGHRLGELSTKALGALEELLADRDAPAQRLGASRAVLDGLLRYREAGEIEARLAELEARSGATNGQRARAWP